MKKHILAIIAAVLLLNIHMTKAQTVDFQFTITNASSATACDGELDIQCTGCIGPVNYTWYDTTNNYNIIGTGNHITGLCVSNSSSYLVVIDDNTCPGHEMFASMKDATISGNTFQMKTSLHYSNYSTNNFVKIQQVSGGNSPYNYYLLATSYADLLFSDSNLTTVTNIEFDSLYDPNGGYNYFELVVGDISNNLIDYVFTTILDTVSCNPEPSPLWASAQGYPTSDSVNCDGWAYATAYGGTPPYTYQFSSGATDSTETGLCPGSYIVTVTDAQSAVFNTTFIVGYPGTMYFSDPGSYNYIDTLYSNAAANCGLDYTMPVDSFFIDSSYAISNWAYVVNWVILQDTNEYSFTETYYIDSTGNYLFGLSVYCEARSSSFGSFSFFSGLFADMSPVATNVAGLKENNKILVYPNPSNGVYHLSSSPKIKEYTIFDQLGRKIIQKKINSADEMINITGFDSGMYYLIVQYQDGTTGKQKLLKK